MLAHTMLRGVRAKANALLGLACVLLHVLGDTNDRRRLHYGVNALARLLEETLPLHVFYLWGYHTRCLILSLQTPPVTTGVGILMINGVVGSLHFYMRSQNILLNQRHLFLICGVESESIIHCLLCLLVLDVFNLSILIVYTLFRDSLFCILSTTAIT